MEDNQLSCSIGDMNEVLQHFSEVNIIIDVADRNKWRMRSIYSIPKQFRDLDESEFTPQVVSFGPYHHGKSHLKEMQSHKFRAVAKLFRRAISEDRKHQRWWLYELNSYGILRFRHYYDQFNPAWWEPRVIKYQFDQTNKHKFSRLMLMDGCFMLDILHTCEPKALSARGYLENDPIFRSGHHASFSMITLIKRDMLLLENQLPLDVLDFILYLDEGDNNYYKEGNRRQVRQKYVRRLIMKFFNLKGPVEKYGSCLHVLDMYRTSLVKEKNVPIPRQSIITLDKSIDVEEAHLARKVRSAEMLQKAGFRFMASKTRSLKDVTFHDGILSLPTIVLDGTTRSYFLNLIAFERLHNQGGHEVMSYISLMSMVTSTTDVQILSDMDIIHNNLASDHSAAQLFIFLSRNVTLLEMDQNTRKILKEMETCYRDRMSKWKRRFREWRLNLHHDYFKNPWSSISVCAAAFLLILTVIQTIYTVTTFYTPDKQPSNAPPAP